MKNILSNPFSGAKRNLFANTVFGYLTIGAPRGSKAPAGFGFYNWVLSPLATNSISLSSDEKLLTITIDARLLEYRQPDKMIFLKGKDSVTFEEKWEAPVEINEKLKATKPVVIYPGKHNMYYSGDVYVITVRLYHSPIRSLLNSFLL